MHIAPKRILKSLLPLLLIGIFNMSSSAQSIKGKVVDASSGEPLIGATVSLKGTAEKTLVRLDGSYVLKNIKPGIYEACMKAIMRFLMPHTRRRGDDALGCGVVTA